MTLNPIEIAETLRRLRVEHRDLDHLISQVASQPGIDQLSLGRMKRRKLKLKDQIIYWESRMIPDLDA